MCQIEDDILMGCRLVIGVNEDNDDDNDIYIIPFFKEPSSPFISFALRNIPLELGEKVLLICFSGEKIES